MLRRASVLAASALVLAATSSCALNAGSGQESPQPAPPPAGNVDPALKVESPKNVSGISDACQLLTPEQRAALQIDGSPAPQQKNDYGAPSCEFVGELTTVFVDINTGHGGISQTYSNKDSFDNFAPTEVTGYPAAQVDAASSLCTVMTGVADDQAIDIYFAKNSAQSPEMDDACGYAKKIAGEALKNVPAA